MAQSSDNGALNYSISLDTDGLWESARRTQEAFDQIGQAATNAGRQMDEGIGDGASAAGDKVKDFADDAKDGLGGVEDIIGRVKKAAAGMAAAFGARELISKVIDVRGEMQQLDVAFTTMLGNAQASSALMQQLVQTAATTPFGLTDVANGAKQLLAYGTAAEDVNETLVRLGDIAAGLSIPLNDLVYLYGTTMAQGRLYTQDLNQFTGRGIPMLGELAKQFGVAQSEVKGLVEAGKVGFPEVQKVIESLTEQGGKFGGLMAAQSKTITGQISNIEDALDMMFNDIGQQSEGVINTALGAVSTLIENYERAGRVIAGLVTAYGLYRTALLIATAAENGATIATVAHAAASRAAAIAMKLLNASMLSNPFVAVAAAIGAVVVALASMKTEAEYAKEATDNYEESKQRIIDAEAEHKQKIDELCATAGDESQATSLRRQALLELEKQYPSIFAKYDTEAEKLRNIANIKREIAALDGKNAFNEEKWNNKRIEELKKKKNRKQVIVYDAEGKAHTQTIENTGPATSEEAAELKVRLKKQKELYKQTQTQRTDAYFLNLQNTSDNVLRYRKKQLDRMMGKAMRAGGEKGAVSSTDTALFGTIAYDLPTLQAYYNKVTDEQNRRAGKGGGKTTPTTPATPKRGGRGGGKGGRTGEKTTPDKAETDEAAKNADTAYKLQQDALKREQELDEQKDKVEQARIDTITDNGEKQRAQLELNHKKELRELEQERRDYLNQKVESAKAAFDANPKNKGKAFNYSAVTLTSEEEKLFDGRRSLLLQKQQIENSALLEAERQAHNEYLKQYGSYMEKRAAMTALAQKQQAQAATQGEKDSIAAQLKKDLEALDFEQFKKQMNWEQVFGDLGTIGTEALESLRDQLTRFISVNKDLDPTNIKTITDAIKNIDDTLATRDPFGKLVSGIKEYAALTGRLKRANEDLKSAGKVTAVGGNGESLAEAYRNAVASGDQLRAEQLKEQEVTMVTANANGELTAKLMTYGEALEYVTKLQNDASSSGSKLAGAFRAAGGNLRSIASVGKNASELLGEFGVKVPEGIGKALSGLGDMGDALEAFDVTKPGSFLNINNYINFAKGAVQAVKGIFTGIAGIFGGGYDWDAYNEMVEKYKALNAQWDELIKKKREYIAESWGQEAAAAGEAANEMVRSQTEAARNMARTWTEAGKDWRHHSQGYNLNKALSDEAKSEAQKFIGSNWQQEVLYNLTPDQLKKLMEDPQMATFWAEVKANAGDFYEYLQQIAAESENLKTNTEATYKALTFTDYDSLEDSFASMLTDMSKSAKDFSEDLEKQFRNAVLRGLINQKYTSQLKAIYEKWAKLTESGNELTADEAAGLKKEYESIVNSALKDRDQLATSMGWSKDATSQSSSTSGFEAMSQDTASELNGRFTALQMDTAAIRAEAAANFATLNQSVGEIQSIALLGLGHLEDISRNTRQLYEIKDALTDIKKHTQRL